MNQQQVKYTLERIDDIHRDKAREIERECSMPSVELSPLKKYRAIEQGRYRLSDRGERLIERERKGEKVTWAGPPRVEDLVDFWDEAEGSRDDDEIRRRKDRLDKRVRDIKDNLVLNNSTEALDMLRGLEAERY